MKVLLLNANSLLGKKFTKALTDLGHEVLTINSKDAYSLETYVKEANVIVHMGVSADDISIPRLRVSNVEFIQKVTEILKRTTTTKPLIYISTSLDNDSDFVKVNRETEQVLKDYFKEKNQPILVIKTSTLYSDTERITEHFALLNWIFKQLNNRYELNKLDFNAELKLVNIDEYVSFLTSVIDMKNWGHYKAPEVHTTTVGKFIETTNYFLKQYRRNQRIELNDDESIFAYQIFRLYYPGAPKVEAPVKKVETPKPVQNTPKMHTNLEKGTLYVYDTSNKGVKCTDYFASLNYKENEKLFIDSTWYSHNYHQLLMNPKMLGDEVQCILIDGVNLKETQVNLLLQILDFPFRNKTIVLFINHEIPINTHFIKVKKLHLNVNAQGQQKESKVNIKQAFNNFVSKFKKEKTAKEPQTSVKQEVKPVKEQVQRESTTKVARVERVEETPVTKPRPVPQERRSKAKNQDEVSVFKNPTFGKKKISKYFLTNQIFFVTFMSLSLISSNLILKNDKSNRIDSTIAAAQYQANRTDEKYIHGVFKTVKQQTNDVYLAQARAYNSEFMKSDINFYVVPTSGTSRAFYQVPFVSDANRNVGALAFNYVYAAGQKLENLNLEQYIVDEDMGLIEASAQPIFISSHLADKLIEEQKENETPEYKNYSDFIGRIYNVLVPNSGPQSWIVKNVLYTSNVPENYVEIDGRKTMPYNGTDKGLGAHLATVIENPFVIFLNEAPLGNLSAQIEFDAYPKGRAMRTLLDTFYQGYTPSDTENPDRDISFSLCDKGAVKNDSFVLNSVNAMYQYPSKDQTFSIVVFSLFMIIFAGVSVNILITNLKEALKYSNSRIHVVLGLIFTVIPIILVNVGIAIYKGASNYSVEALTLQNTFGIVAHFVITLLMAGLNLIFFFNLRNEKVKKGVDNNNG